MPFILLDKNYRVPVKNGSEGASEKSRRETSKRDCGAKGRMGK